MLTVSSYIIDEYSQDISNHFKIEKNVFIILNLYTVQQINRFLYTFILITYLYCFFSNPGYIPPSLVI